MSYIRATDIKSSLAKGFDLTDYLSETDAEIEDLAQSLGVYNTEDIAIPLHNKVLRFGIVFLLMRLCQDKMSTNDVSIDALEKYTLQYGMYKKELSGLRAEISKEMVLNEVGRMVDRSVYSGLIYRT